MATNPARERLRPPDMESPLVVDRFARVMDLLSPRPQPRKDEEQKPELAASFWMRGTLAIAGILSAMQQYREYERIVEGGIYRGEEVFVQGEDGSPLLVDSETLVDTYEHIEGVLTDLVRVGMDVPGGDTFALIPQVAMLQRGEEFGREVQTWYERFQVARAEQYFGIKLTSSKDMVDGSITS